MTPHATAIDLFAGLGGFSVAAKKAGLDVLWAANHWKLAVQIHANNHPDTKHVCQDLQQADWSLVPRHDVLLASPACQGHSTASQPKRIAKHDADRATAWAVVSCAEAHRAPVVVVENVPLFREWVLYPAWKMAMQALGYSLAEHVLDAADFGVPQNRSRLFIVATKSKAPIALRLETVEHVAARSFIDLSDIGSWDKVAGRSAAVLGRVSRGRARFGDEPFITHSGWSKHSGRSIDRPIGTITTKDGQWGVVAGDRMRGLTVDEYSAAMTFPESYSASVAMLPRTHAVKLIGNAVAPLQGAALLRAVLAAA